MRSVLCMVAIRVYSAFMAGAALVLPYVTTAKRKKEWAIAERTGLPRIVRGHRSSSVVWVHAASLGEAKLLLQFLQVLERRNPDHCYVVTAATRAGVDFLERMRRPTIYAIGYLPIDSIGRMKALLKAFSITRAWILETELWPSMLYACYKNNIPVGIANARIEERSFVRYRRWSFLLSPLLKGLDIVLAQNTSYAERFVALGVSRERVHVVGNLKTHAPIAPPSRRERDRLREALGIDPDAVVITAGCLHAGEGVVVKAAIDILRRRGRACKLIVVPRHLHEAGTIAAEFGNECVRLPDITASSPWETCQIEKLGILEPMYRLSDAAIVGGTFVDIGGHNVWEAAQVGIPVFFGPYFYEQRSSCEKLLAAGVGFMAENADGLAGGIEKNLWKSPADFRVARDCFAKETNGQTLILEPLIP